MYQFINALKGLYTDKQQNARAISGWRNGTDFVQDSDEDDSQQIEEKKMELDELEYEPANLKLVIILSGKRKSGKDHISTLLTNYIGYERMPNLAILRIAGPIKKEFAKNNKLDFDRLLDSSAYKEQFRFSMVEWSERYREKVGWNCFIKQAIKEQRAKHKRIWILNDARRPCDIAFFEDDPVFEDTKIIKLRIEASSEARESRGWKYTYGIDDRETECGLDFYEDWTQIIDNNHNDQKEVLMEALRPIFDEIDKALEESFL